MVVFFKVKPSTRTLQVISVKLSSMSSVLGLPSWLLLEPKSLLYPVEGVMCPEFAYPSIHDKLQFDFKYFISVMIAIKVPSHSHGSTQFQVNLLLLRYWILSLSTLYSLAALFLSLCNILKKALKR